MKAYLESTTKMVELVTPDGGKVEARIWEGFTEAGVPMHAFIVRVAVREDERRADFEADLEPRAKPSEDVAHYPARMIL